MCTNSAFRYEIEIWTEPESFYDVSHYLVATALASGASMAYIPVHKGRAVPGQGQATRLRLLLWHIKLCEAGGRRRGRSLPAARSHAKLCHQDEAYGEDDRDADGYEDRDCDPSGVEGGHDGGLLHADVLEDGCCAAAVANEALVPTAVVGAQVLNNQSLRQKYTF